ncbi:hypothetical protein AAUPMC_14565, partial [Pasteurella multocida subsp. multocida str. Anand1_cattle]
TVLQKKYGEVAYHYATGPHFPSDIEALEHKKPIF